MGSYAKCHVNTIVDFVLNNKVLLLFDWAIYRNTNFKSFE